MATIIQGSADSTFGGTIESTGIDVTGTARADKLQAENGTASTNAATPQFTFGDSNTGMFWGGSDTIGFSTGANERMRITSSGNVGIGNTGPDVKLALHETAAIISGGVADRTSTMKGIKITTPQNGDESLGLWFGTGGSHWSGISGQRSSAASTWGTDLRFYTHQNGTSGLTTSTERMRIDSSGSVTMPNQPRASLSHTGSVSQSNSVLTSSNFYDTTYCNIGNHFNASTGRFTCPVAGVYRLYLRYTSNGSGANVRLRKNANTVTEVYDNLSGSSSVSSEIVVSCQANDFLDIQAYTMQAVNGTQHKQVTFELLG